MFEALNNITIINILRDYATICNSHPSFIIKVIKEFILNATYDEITVLELKNKIDNCIRENNYDIDINDVYNKLISTLFSLLIYFLNAIFVFCNYPFVV